MWRGVTWIQWSGGRGAPQPWYRGADVTMCDRRQRPGTLILALVLLAGSCWSSAGGGGQRDAAMDGGHPGGDAAGDADAGAPGDAASDAAGYPFPTAVQVPSSSAPANLPAGTFVTCIDSSDATRFSDTCWVLKWGRWTYWVLAYTDSRLIELFTPFDAQGQIAPGGDWPKERPGARYVLQMSVDSNAQTVTIIGQAGNAVTVAWADLRVDQPPLAPPDAGPEVPAGDAATDAATFADPTAVQVPSTSAPAALPAGAAVRCVVSGSDPTASSTCWVIKWGRWTYWAFSYTDNRSSFLIAPYAPTGAIAAQAPWPLEKAGARYLWQASVDTSAQTVTFLGQASGAVTMPWSDLRIDQQ